MEREIVLRPRDRASAEREDDAGAGACPQDLFRFVPAEPFFAFFGEDLRNLFTETGSQTEKVTEGVKNSDISSSFSRAPQQKQSGDQGGK